MSWYTVYAARHQMTYEQALQVFQFLPGSRPSIDEVKKKYRALAMESNHADRGNANSSINIIQLNNAKEVLQDTSIPIERSVERRAPASQPSYRQTRPAWETDSHASSWNVGPDFRDVNYCKKDIYEKSLKYGKLEEYTFMAFDGYFFRGSFRVKANEFTIGYAGKVMAKWNSEGGNPYHTDAVICCKGGSTDWKVVQIKGRDVSSQNIVIPQGESYPVNDRKFANKLQDIVNGIDVTA